MLGGDRTERCARAHSDVGELPPISRPRRRFDQLRAPMPAKISHAPATNGPEALLPVRAVVGAAEAPATATASFRSWPAATAAVASVEAEALLGAVVELLAGATDVDVAAGAVVVVDMVDVVDSVSDAPVTGPPGSVMVRFAPPSLSPRPPSTRSRIHTRLSAPATMVVSSDAPVRVCASGSNEYQLGAAPWLEAPYFQ